MLPFKTPHFMEELTDEEMQRIHDIQSHDELTAFVAELPCPSLTMERDYQSKMNYLHAIRAEVFPEPAAPEWQPDEMHHSKYTYEYNVGTF